MKAISLIPALLLVAATGAQAQGMPMDMPMNKPAKTSPGKQVPFVNAEIVQVDVKAGKVTLKHEDVPNLNMPGMTMAFPVKDKKALKGVKVGDRVRVQFESLKGQATVVAVKPAK